MATKLDHWSLQKRSVTKLTHPFGVVWDAPKISLGFLRLNIISMNLIRILSEDEFKEELLSMVSKKLHELTSIFTTLPLQSSISNCYSCNDIPFVTAPPLRAVVVSMPRFQWIWLNPNPPAPGFKKKNRSTKGWSWRLFAKKTTDSWNKQVVSGDSGM